MTLVRRTLENLARSQNLELVVSYMPPMTREDRRSLAFHQAIVEHLRKKPDEILDKVKNNLNKLIRMHPGAGTLLGEWEGWLDLPLEDLVGRMLDPFPHAREMRQVSPFSGVLNAEDRALVLKEFQRAYKK